MMTKTSFPVLVELYRHFRSDQFQPRSLQYHLARVFPRLRFKVDPLQGGASQAAHAAMDVGIMAAVDPIQNPGSERRPEIAMQTGHRSALDTAAEAAAHDELSTFAERFHEGR